MSKHSTKTKGLSKGQSANTAVQAPVLVERIAEKAYELFRQRGSVHGHDLEHWLEAERLVTGDRQVRGWSSAG